MPAYTAICTLPTNNEPGKESFINEVVAFFESIPIITLVSKTFTPPGGQGMKSAIFQIGNSSHYLYIYTITGGACYWGMYVLGVSGLSNSKMLNWRPEIALGNPAGSITFYVMASDSVVMIKMDTDHGVTYMKSDLGNWFILHYDMSTVLNYNSDVSTFTLVKPYYTYKDVNGNYLCVPAKIRNNSINQILADQFNKVLTTLAFVNESAFYTLDSGLLSWYKANILIIDS